MPQVGKHAKRHMLVMSMNADEVN